MSTTYEKVYREHAKKSSSIFCPHTLRSTTIFGDHGSERLPSPTFRMYPAQRKGGVAGREEDLSVTLGRDNPRASASHLQGPWGHLPHRSSKRMNGRA